MVVQWWCINFLKLNNNFQDSATENFILPAEWVSLRWSAKQISDEVRWKERGDEHIVVNGPQFPAFNELRAFKPAPVLGDVVADAAVYLLSATTRTNDFNNHSLLERQIARSNH